MNKTIFISALAAAALTGCSANDTAETDTTDESPAAETTAGGGADMSADNSADAASTPDMGSPVETDDNGTSLTVGPDGARLNVDGDNVDASVGDGPDRVTISDQ